MLLKKNPETFNYVITVDLGNSPNLAGVAVRVTNLSLVPLSRNPEPELQIAVVMESEAKYTVKCGVIV